MWFRISNVLALFVLALVMLTGYLEIAVVKVTTPESYQIHSYGIWEGLEFEVPAISDWIGKVMTVVKIAFGIAFLIVVGVILSGRRFTLQQRLWEVLLIFEILVMILTIWMLSELADELGGKIEFSLGAILYIMVIAISVLGWRATLRDILLYKRRKGRQVR